MKYFSLISLFVLTTSCQFFETEKIASETFYEEELKSIDWSRVDQYPSVVSCDNISEREAQKQCFVSALSSKIYSGLAAQDIQLKIDVRDTVLLDFSVRQNADLEVTNIAMDSLTELALPKLKDWLLVSVSEMKLNAPAYKRGIPVETAFTLPIVIHTNNY